MSAMQADGASDARSMPGRGAFGPVLLLALAMIALLVFQATQLVSDHGSLKRVRAGQEKAMAESRALRVQLDGIASDLARLAQQGNANARRVVEQLRQRGVTIKPQAASAQEGD